MRLLVRALGFSGVGELKDFRQLTVWEKAHQLALSVYRETQCYPKEETYGLTSQTRRAASSVPTNIAEGCGRNSDQDFARFLQIAMGSVNELDYQLILAQDLGYLRDNVFNSLAQSVMEVKRMLASLIRKVRPNS